MLDPYYSESESPAPVVYNDSVQKYSTLLFDIRSSETGYKLLLSKLLACCSPLKSPTASSPTSSTNIIRKLIAHHSELSRFISGSDEIENMGNFISWCGNSISIYTHYIEQYSLDKDMTDMEIQLRKQPLRRIIQLNKFIIRLLEINYDLNVSMTFDHNIPHKFKNLVISAKNKNEKVNLSLDLSTIYFHKVRELNADYTKTVSYFEFDKVAKRDYFKFDLIHPLLNKIDILVELFQLDDNTLAICSVESIGRNLMFPPLRLNEFKLVDNDSHGIKLIKDLEDDEKIELFFSCPDHDQMSIWNEIFYELNSTDNDNEFIEKYYNLNGLKNNKVGLGIFIKDSSSSAINALRKSSPMSSKHNSLKLTDSPVLKEISPNVIEQKSIKNTPKPAKVKSIYSNESTVFSSTASLPLPKQSTASLTLLNNNSTSDLTKVKRRRSIFNIFSKKKDDEPEFEIVTKQSISSSANQSSSSANQSSSSSLSTLNKDNQSLHKSSSSTSVSKAPLSMAALNRNVKNLSINTSVSTTSLPKEESLPSPFASPSKSNKINTLTAIEERFLATTSVQQVLKNSIICSIWNNNKWEIIGKEYQNQLKFYRNNEYLVMSIFTNDSLIPDLMLPLNNSRTAVRKASALDLQIRCLKSIEATQLIMINIRCRDSKTINLIMESIEDNDKIDETISASSSEVFSEKNLPSNSTSMSSIDTVNKDEIISLGMPKRALYGITNSSNSNSTLNLNTPTSSTSSLTPTSNMNELLMKSSIKIKLHQKDDDDEWIPLSIGKLNIYSNLLNPSYSKFDIKLQNGFRSTTLVKNSTCKRIGKSGLTFNSNDETGKEIDYLIEFRNTTECHDSYELLQ